jgi:ribonuclease BN (tRNA processing enzyme)
MTSHAMLSEGGAYVLDCGVGVINQYASTGIPFRALRSIFITHHHPDHNIEYGPLLVEGWVNGMQLDVRAFGPPAAQSDDRGSHACLQDDGRFLGRGFQDEATGCG